MGTNCNSRAQRRDVWLLLLEQWLRREHQDAWAGITAQPLTTSPGTNGFVASACALKMEATVTAEGRDVEGRGGSFLELPST